VEVRVDERTVGNLVGCAGVFKVMVEGGGGGQAMRLAAHAGTAGRVASLDGLGLTGEDIQLGTLSFGLPDKGVVLDSSDVLLGEGPGRNRAGQRGGGT